jgi:hypothetical protein
MALCLVLLPPDGTAVPILFFAAVFIPLGALVGALTYTVLSVVISLLKIGMLRFAAAMVSGLPLEHCPQITVNGETGKWSNAQTASRLPLNHGDCHGKPRQSR